MTSPLRRKHRTTAPNTQGSKTADRRRTLQAIQLGCGLLAASLLSAATVHASDVAWSPQTARIQASEMPSDADQASDAAQPASKSAEASHTTKLKWRAFRPGISHSTDSTDTKSDAADSESAQSSDVQPVYSDAEPISASSRPVRAIRDSSIVPAQALQPTNPSSNPFGDDPNQPNAQPMPLPAPGGTTPAPTNPAIPDTGPLSPSTTTPEAMAPGGSSVFPRSRTTRPRAPARLNQDLPLETPTIPPRGSAPITPYISPSPSDIEDLSCATHQHRCQDDEAALMQKTVNKIGLDITEYGKQGSDLPCDCNIGDRVVFESRHWPLITYTWKASALCHKPLYFEEVQLERYGHSPGPIVEPLLSAAHFFVTVPLLPYYMGVDPPFECQYSLGYYRPGDCAPYMLDPFPLSVRGAVLEAGAVVGVTAVIP